MRVIFQTRVVAASQEMISVMRTSSQRDEVRGLGDGKGREAINIY